MDNYFDPCKTQIKKLRIRTVISNDFCHATKDSEAIIISFMRLRLTESLGVAICREIRTGIGSRLGEFPFLQVPHRTV